MHGRVRVYIATSLDGFIAGPDDDLSWLPGASEASEAPAPAPEAVTYEQFTADVGAMLMGRRTYDVVRSFDMPWPYGDTPVLVPTRRPLEGAPPAVRPCAGDITELVHAAKEAAGGKDVYLDGGDLIRQALDAALIDELIVTVVPTVLGRGVPLFAGATRRHALEFLSVHRYGDMLQWIARPKGRP